MIYTLDRIRNSSATNSNPTATLDDPLRHLLACHDRIEERLQTLERVVPHLRSDSQAKRQEARDALDKALEFLQKMGPLHTQDEEESVFPRLLAKGSEEAAALKELTDLLESQHREKEEVFEELVAQVRSFPSAPQPPSAEQVIRFEGLVEHLVALYRPHIMIENQRLIPLSAEYLNEGDLQEVRKEMRRRRGQ